MNSKLRLVMFAFVAIAVGLILARANFRTSKSSRKLDATSDSVTKRVDSQSTWLAQVGNEYIMNEDLDWEVELHTNVPKFSATDLPTPKSIADFK